MSRAPLDATVRRLERASGALATQSVARMDETVPWFRSMPADQRSWIMLVAQSGIAAFIHWLRDPSRPPEITGEVFGAAPRELTRAVSLQRTVELIRVAVDVMESQVANLAAPGEEQRLREAVLRYSREVAFSAAGVYAGVAENRGDWDVRLQALLIDALLHRDPGDVLASRAATLGWTQVRPVCVVVGRPPDRPADAVLDAVQRAARQAGVEAVAGVQGDRLVLVLGGTEHPIDGLKPLLPEFGDGPIVVGPLAAGVADAVQSAHAALAGARAVAGWPDAPRPVAAAELLPERALVGDESARRTMIEETYKPLAGAGSHLLETASVYLEVGRSLEATARALFVHPNTVRYRLRRVGEVTGLAPSHPRDAYVLKIALVLGRIDQAERGL